MKFVFLFFCATFIFLGFAQIDEAYIQNIDNKTTIAVRLGLLNNAFTLKNNADVYALNTSYSPSVSFWLKYKKLPPITLSLPLNIFLSPSVFKTRVFKIALKAKIYKGFIVESYLLSEKGFRLTNKIDLSESKIFGNTRNLETNIDFIYIFNHKKFSYSSAYLFGAIQKKSSGSFSLGLQTGYFDLLNRQSIFDNDSFSGSLDFKHIGNLRLSLFAGYLYSVVFGKDKKWVLTNALFLGPQFQKGKTQYFNNIEETSIGNVRAYFKYKFSLAYNINRWLINGTFFSTLQSIKPTKAFYINTLTNEIKLSVFYKF